MTRRSADQLLAKACELIFKVEQEFKEGEYPRTVGYQARCRVADFQNAIRESKQLSEILP